jgi:pyrroloquinoline quinone (PQQ) biosynthesis protein C
MSSELIEPRVRPCGVSQLTTHERSHILMEIEAEFLRHPILEHPFLKRLSAGGFTKEQVKVWVSQQFYFSTQFPRCLAALYARIDDFHASKPLVDFLSVEHWGSESKGAHWKQFRKALRYFDLQIGDLMVMQPFPETSEYLNFRLSLCLHRTVEEGIGAVGFGHELVNERIFESYFKGMCCIRDIPEDVLTYFKVHVQDEPDDYEVFKQLMLTGAENRKAFGLLRKGAHDVLKARSKFFDAMYERFRT